MLVRQRSPALRQKASQRLESPQRLPSQQGGIATPHDCPGRVQNSDVRQVPAVQLPEQQSRLTTQPPPSLRHAVASTQSPPAQVSPAQQPEPHDCPAVRQVGGVWQVPETHERPVQQPVPHGCPEAPQVVSAEHTPETQRVPAQHSPSKTHERPVVRHPQVPPVHSM